jgi:hypothetical protein
MRDITRCEMSVRGLERWWLKRELEQRWLRYRRKLEGERDGIEIVGLSPFPVESSRRSELPISTGYDSTHAQISSILMLMVQRNEVKLESLDRRNPSWILEICKCVMFDVSGNRMKDVSKHTFEI